MVELEAEILARLGCLREGGLYRLAVDAVLGLDERAIHKVFAGQDGHARVLGGKLGPLWKGNGKSGEDLVFIGLELPGQARLLAAQDVAAGISIGLCGELLHLKGAGRRRRKNSAAAQSASRKGTGNSQTTQGRTGAAECCVHGFSHDKTPYAPARQSTREYAQRPLPR